MALAVRRARATGAPAVFWLLAGMAHELREPTAAFATHEVANQAPPLADRNLFDDNLPLVEALGARGRRLGAASAPARSARRGAERRSAGASRPTSIRRG